MVALACAALLAAPAAARADDPPLVNWSALLPGAPGVQYDPNSADECVAGRLSCVDKTIREMYRRWQPLSDSCSHNAIFALTYLRTTEQYRIATTTDGFFDDPAFVNHEDAVFAAYYFRAYDDYAAGNRAAVPAAWQIAFDAARDHAVYGLGNVLLGMNAHINRDLPYVLEAIGLVKPDGTSRKPDHDKVNAFLNRVLGPLLPELARRYDPTVDDAQVPGTLLDDFVAFQLVPAWREEAWRNAERLATAATPAARADVAASIDAAAAQEAQLIKATTAYGVGQSSASRDAYCAVHHNDA